MLTKLALGVGIGLQILILLELRKVNRKMSQNSDALNQLASDVHNESSAVDSAIVLVNGLSNRLTDLLSQNLAPEDLTAQIQSLRDEVNNKAVELGQAVAAGTAAENDSSNFPVSAPTSTSTPNDSGTTASDSSTTSTESTGTTSSDTSTTSSDTTTSDSAPQGSDATPAPDTSATAGAPASPAGDGTADVVVPDQGTSTPDESTTTTSDSTPSDTSSDTPSAA